MIYLWASGLLLSTLVMVIGSPSPEPAVPINQLTGAFFKEYAITLAFPENTLDLYVQESATLVTDGVSVKRGFDRILPLSMGGALGSRALAYEIQLASRQLVDGDEKPQLVILPAPHSVDEKGFVISLEKGDDTLAAGSYQYSLSYLVKGALTKQGDSYLLFWEVNPSMPVPINQVTAEVLPFWGGSQMSAVSFINVPNAVTKSQRPFARLGPVGVETSCAVESSRLCKDTKALSFSFVPQLHEKLQIKVTWPGTFVTGAPHETI